MKKLAVFLVIIAIVGIFLAGRVITGYAIGESCCGWGNCTFEEVCDAYKDMAPGEVPDQLYVGIGLTAISIMLYLLGRLTEEEK